MRLPSLIILSLILGATSSSLRHQSSVSSWPRRLGGMYQK